MILSSDSRGARSDPVGRQPRVLPCAAHPLLDPREHVRRGRVGRSRKPRGVLPDHDAHRHPVEMDPRHEGIVPCGDDGKDVQTDERAFGPAAARANCCCTA